MFFVYTTGSGLVRIQGSNPGTNLVLTGAGTNLDLNAVGESVHLLCVDNGAGVGVWYLVGGQGYSIS